MLRSVDGYLVADVSGQRIGHILKGKAFQEPSVNYLPIYGA